MLIDTSALMALYSKEERYHKECLSQFKLLAEKGIRGIMVETVIEELILLVRKRVSREAAGKIAKDILKNKMIRVVFLNDKLMRETVEVFLKHKGEYSYVDCSEYVYAKAFGYSQIIAVDSDFGKLGLEVFPKVG